MVSGRFRQDMEIAPISENLHEARRQAMANRKGQNLMRRARWDRIFGALAILIILIVLLVSALKSCGKNKEPAESGNTAETQENVAPASIVTTEATQEAETTPAVVDNSMAVFLSPSTQENNEYACDPTISEEQVMFDLANRVSMLLQADGYTVYMCSRDDNVKAKVKQGNTYGCGAYVALHSNSGSDGPGGSGTECYYNTEIEGSEDLAQNIYNRVAELTPTEDRGLKDQNQRDLYEILNNRYPCCLLEVDFHDNEEQSQWIIDNLDETAKCICDGIEAFLKSRDTSDAPVVMNPEEVFGDES
ncbi:MAG TPA: hypothetical protein DCO72_11055 [Ruminococcus sp.]|nr:hypothetical protein [Ruminococcus sp.]